MRLKLVCVRCAFAAALAVSCAAAQSPEAGTTPEWEARAQLGAMAQRAQRLKAALDETQPQQWTAKGASAAYVDQGKRVQTELGYVANSAQALAKTPEKLPLALETYFRMQSNDGLLRSYIEGVRKYQNEALADLLLSLARDAASDREALRDYIMQLASTREQEFQIADQEASRCRSGPPRKPAGKSKDQR